MLNIESQENWLNKSNKKEHLDNEFAEMVNDLLNLRD